jgi:hypothetical protein
VTRIGQYRAKYMPRTGSGISTLQITHLLTPVGRSSLFAAFLGFAPEY